MSLCRFGAYALDMKAIPEWSHQIVQSPVMAPLTGLGQQTVDYLKKNGAEANFGDYMYGLVIFVILTLIGLTYIVVGREEAEEKMYLPVKK